MVGPPGSPRGSFPVVGYQLVLLGTSKWEPAGAQNYEAFEVILCRGRHGGELGEWVAIEGLPLGNQPLTLTVQGARPLVSVLAQMVAPPEWE